MTFVTTSLSQFVYLKPKKGLYSDRKERKRGKTIECIIS